MSSFSSFLIADAALKQDGFQHLGYAGGGADDAADRSYWLDTEGPGTVVEGHPKWGEDRYEVSSQTADIGLLPALIAIIHSQSPHLTSTECTTAALARAEHFDFIPQSPLK